jgi:hypothetical protein
MNWTGTKSTVLLKSLVQMKQRRADSANMAIRDIRDDCKWIDRVNMTIDRHGQGQRTSQLQEIRFLVRDKLTGNKRDMDSAIVAIQHEQQEEPTELSKPSVCMN